MVILPERSRVFARSSINQGFLARRPSKRQGIELYFIVRVRREHWIFQASSIDFERQRDRGRAERKGRKADSGRRILATSRRGRTGGHDGG